MRCVYVDLDGTLLGPGGSLLRGGDERFSLDGVRALQACDRAGVEVVIYSGRRYASVYEDARLLGHGSFIFELGCGMVLDGELEWLTDGIVPSEEAGTIHDQIARSGGPALLLECFEGSLEYHTPWSEGRDVSHLFRGQIAVSDADAVLARAELEWLRLVDNGVIRAGSDGRDSPDRLHAYHLIPASASKARAVARHMQNRGYSSDECIAIGDSREDLAAAAAVGGFWLVANALERDPTLVDELKRHRGVRVAEQSYGAGVYEAVVSTLAESRAA
jgi:hydroxymethylpyrimidine pyrophosphatase-like HAD family hydrolase